MSATPTFDKSNPLVLVGAAAGAVALGLLLWLFVVQPLTAGDPEDLTVQAAPAAPRTQAQDADVADEADADVEALPLSTYEVALTRDPFADVIPDLDPSSGESDGGATATPTAAGGTGGTGGTGGAGGGEATTCEGGSSEMVCDGLVVEPVAAEGSGFEATATIRVDETSYDVVPGAVFADRFLVLSIDAPCVDVLYGDESFTICVGQQLLK